MSSMNAHGVSFFSRSGRYLGPIGAAAFAVLAACSSNGGAPDAAVTCAAATGGATPGPADTHCGSTVQPTLASSCHVQPDAAAPGDDGGGDDGGGDDGGATVDAGDIGTCGSAAYGATMYGSQGSDDDCKYDVTWTSMPICLNVPVYFSVTVKYRTDQSPVTGATVGPDVVLSCKYPIPNDPAPLYPSPETTPGTYKVGPVKFDRAGKWVVRFHINGDCVDLLPTSPHGHAAFWVTVQ